MDLKIYIFQMVKSLKMDLKTYIIPYININVLKWKNTNVVIFLFEVSGFKKKNISNG
jgi:hypothetical protein